MYFSDGVPTHVSMPDDFASSVVLRARIRAIQWQIESMDGSVAGPECGGGGVTSSRETQPTERPRVRHQKENKDTYIDRIHGSSKVVQMLGTVFWWP